MRANLAITLSTGPRQGWRLIAFEPNPLTRCAPLESVRLNNLDDLVACCSAALGAKNWRWNSLQTLLAENQGAVAVEPAADGYI